MKKIKNIRDKYRETEDKIVIIETVEERLYTGSWNGSDNDCMGCHDNVAIHVST